MTPQFLGSGRQFAVCFRHFSESISRVVEYEPFFGEFSSGMGFFITLGTVRLRLASGGYGPLARVLDESGEVWVDNRTLFDEETYKDNTPEDETGWNGVVDYRSTPMQRVTR